MAVVKERRMLRLLRDWKTANEIGEYFSISRQAAWYQLRQLRKEGMLEQRKEPGDEFGEYETQGRPAYQFKVTDAVMRDIV